jgi:hypothetical protein
MALGYFARLLLVYLARLPPQHMGAAGYCVIQHLLLLLLLLAVHRMTSVLNKSAVCTDCGVVLGA